MAWDKSDNLLPKSNILAKVFIYESFSQLPSLNLDFASMWHFSVPQIRLNIHNSSAVFVKGFLSSKMWLKIF